MGIVLRLLPADDDPSRPLVVEYSYILSLGNQPDSDWILRFDYVPEEAHRDDYPYPGAHVHVNAFSPTYSSVVEPRTQKPLERIHIPTRPISLAEFIELLVVEFDVPTRMQREDALALLRVSRFELHG